jgi:hypothetical protein
VFRFRSAAGVSVREKGTVAWRGAFAIFLLKHWPTGTPRSGVAAAPLGVSVPLCVGVSVRLERKRRWAVDCFFVAFVCFLLAPTFRGIRVGPAVRPCLWGDSGRDAPRTAWGETPQPLSAIHNPQSTIHNPRSTICYPPSGGRFGWVWAEGGDDFAEVGEDVGERGGGGSGGWLTFGARHQVDLVIDVGGGFDQD